MISPVSFFPGFRREALPMVQPAAGTGACCEFADLKSLKPADVLIPLAHPDDETFLSGTAARLQQNGYSVQFVYITDGNGGRDVTCQGLSGRALGVVRREETARALKELGIERPPLFLDFQDGRIPQSAEEILPVMQEIIGKVKPRLILTFNPGDGITDHPDHKSIGAITNQAAETAGRLGNVYHMGLSPEAFRQFDKAFGIAGTSSWMNLRPAATPIRVKVDVSDQVLKKLRAIEAHCTQFPHSDIDGFKAFYAAYAFEEFSKAGR